MEVQCKPTVANKETEFKGTSETDALIREGREAAALVRR